MEGVICCGWLVTWLDLPGHRSDFILAEGRVWHAQTLFNLDDLLVCDHRVDKLYEMFFANLLRQGHNLLLFELIV